MTQEERRTEICRFFCKDKDASAAKRRLMVHLNYSSVMAEKLVNEWAEYMEIDLPFHRMLIRGAYV